MKMLIIALALLTPACAAKVKLYRITPVVTIADSVKCAQAGGHAGLIADLDENGSPASAWVAGCILEVNPAHRQPVIHSH